MTRTEDRCPFCSGTNVRATGRAGREGQSQRRCCRCGHAWWVVPPAARRSFHRFREHVRAERINEVEG